MAHTTLPIAFCLLVPRVIALYISVNKNDSPRSFLSKNKLYCAQAQEGIASDALNLFKSMPRSELYEGTILNLNKSCLDMGYKQSAGEDPCYPGLHVFYHRKEDGQQFVRHLRNHLEEFGKSRNLTLDETSLMDTCKCHKRSHAKNNVGKTFNKSCGKSQSLFSDVPRCFVSKNKLFCAQAEEGIATDALNLFKSMPRGKLFDGTMLNSQLSCSDMGYNHSNGEDQCYPGLHTFYHSEEEGRQFVRELQNHLKEFGESRNLTLDEANFVDKCECKDRSYARIFAGKMLKKSCDDTPRQSTVAPVNPKA